MLNLEQDIARMVAIKLASIKEDPEKYAGVLSYFKGALGFSDDAAKALNKSTSRAVAGTKRPAIAVKWGKDFDNLPSGSGKSNLQAREEKAVARSGK